MQVVIEGLGKFPATPPEEAWLAAHAAAYPDLSPEELLCALYLSRCIAVALDSPVRQEIDGDHALASDLLAVSVDVAHGVFGRDAPRWLVAIGIRGSRSFGDAVWKFIHLGIFGSQPQDRPEQFDVLSRLDDFIQTS